MITLSIPVWLILVPLTYIALGIGTHAIVYFTSPYSSGKENGFGRGEDTLQLIADTIFWPLIAVSLPIYFRDLKRRRNTQN